MQYPLSELLDRITICKLKVERAGSEACQHEYHLLRSHLTNYGFPQAESFLEKLYAVNASIWDLECDIREGREHELGLEEIGRRALRIRNLNNQRVALKNQIVSESQIGFVDAKYR